MMLESLNLKKSEREGVSPFFSLESAKDLEVAPLAGCINGRPYTKEL